MKAWTHLLAVCLALTWMATTTDAEEDNGNLAPNPSFEQPAGGTGELPNGWNSYSSVKDRRLGITTDDKRTGEQSVRLETLKVKNGAQGLLLDLENIEEGKKYNFEAYVKNDRGAPLDGTAHGLLVIEWLDESGKELARSVSKGWGRNLTRMRWTRVYLKNERAPKGCAKARFGIHVSDGDGNGRGAFLVDDVKLTK